MVIYIVTPALNSDRTIEQTLASVANQLHPERIVYHVQDGGSDDDTLNILSRWQERFSKRGIKFSFSSEPDRGIYDALVKGFSRFEPKADDGMTWINSDDQISGLFSYTLLKQPSYIRWLTGQPAVIGSMGRAIRLDRYYSTSLVAAGLCDGNSWFYLQQEGTAWRHYLWASACSERVLAKYQYAGDFHLWVAFAQRDEVYQCNFPMGFFNIRSGQVSQAQKERYCREIQLLSSDRRSLRGEHEVKLITLHGGRHFQKYSLNIQSKSAFDLESRDV